MYFENTVRSSFLLLKTKIVCLHQSARVEWSLGGDAGGQQQLLGVKVHCWPAFTPIVLCALIITQGVMQGVTGGSATCPHRDTVRSCKRDFCFYF